MRWFALLGGIGLLVCGLVGTARADGWRSPAYSPYTPNYVVPPGCATPSAPPSMSPSSPPLTMPNTSPTTPPSTTTPTPAPATTPDATAAAQGEAGSAALGSSAPTMIGDLMSPGFSGSFNHSSTPTSRSSSGSSRSSSRTALLSAGAFKIAENESPRPQDRIFFNYNYFSNVNTFGGSTFNLHRETMGFEKTFMDGDASFGMRLPVLLKDGSGGGGVDGFGDLSLLLKYALINNRETGNVLSGGLVVTIPTGRDLYDVDGTDLHSWLIQPFVGGILSAGDFYGIAFSSLIIPTESKNAALFSNDIGIGYRLYQSNEERVITSLTPTLEGHLTNALNHDGLNSSLGGFPTAVFDVTAGVHIGLWNTATLTVAGAVPLTGPKPNDYELLLQLNIKF